MKILKTTLLLVIISCLTYSCSKDSTANEEEILADQQNELEEANIPLEDLNSGISIDGATKNAGTPPQPTGDVNIEISSDKAEAFQKAGFNLKFSTTETDIAGAYLLFKDSDNNTASDYFDIPVSELTTYNKSGDTKGNNSSKKNLLFKSNNSLVDGDYEIDVNFGDSFPPGKFCADLCIYDQENNISQIVTVCVEVEAWGGNASIVGEWLLEEESFDNGEYTIVCENEESIEADYSQVIKDEIIFNVDNNGDFYVTYYEEYKDLDYEASRTNCSAIYSDDIEKYNDKETGKWAYNETNSTLTLVSFKYEDFIEPQYSEDYPNGELLFEGDKVEIIDGKLVITSTYTEGDETYTDIFTFVRK
ncbi:hypothetical protein [Flavivirga jejuensis]|uniref:Lipocalin-like protein n=1 Tax=Flavivirga jejuensis TaxID=870487 RepID=A0ABT8WTG5_9FLAO|nr:hypothetical protein [Flavivirga jejuensis]MDO5976461.1 hypothetical protein [Flavivirga jejuensis]